MGVFTKLLENYIEPCNNTQRRYIQKLVLVNKSDVLEYIIMQPRISINGDLLINNRIYFRLKESLSGRLITNIYNGYNIAANCDANENDYGQTFIHSLKFVVSGYSEKLIYFLNSINTGLYFGAALLNDGSVQIYGFDNGLHCENYEMDLQGNGGITQINLQTANNEQEYMPPLFYASPNGTAQNDFDNLFKDIPEIIIGDFSDDFNNDFNN